jgi:hypothetical protein
MEGDAAVTQAVVAGLVVLCFGCGVPGLAVIACSPIKLGEHHLIWQLQCGSRRPERTW